MLEQTAKRSVWAAVAGFLGILWMLSVPQFSYESCHRRYYRCSLDALISYDRSRPGQKFDT
jgi:hypothetical protein